MIDEYYTWIFYGYHSDELKPKSGKPIVVMCDECGIYRSIRKSAYRDLCYKCGNIAINRKRILPITDIELKREYESGLNTVQLSNKYKCSSTLINDRLRFVNCKIRDNKFILPLTNMELKEKYESGLTIYQLAEICNCSIQPILTKLREINCKIRSNSESHRGKTRTIESRLKQGESSKGIGKGKIVSLETREKLSVAQLKRNENIETRILNSCRQQGIDRKDWNGFAKENPYCSKFNNQLKIKIRDQYNNCDYISGIHKSICSPDRELSIHHVDYNKDQGCNGNKWKLIPLSQSNHVRTNVNRSFWNRLFIYSLQYEKEYYGDE